MCVFCYTRSLVVWLFQVLLFCCHLFICDPACAVVLRMSSVPPQKRKRCVLSIKLQTYKIFIVMDRVQSRHVRIADIPLYINLVIVSIGLQNCWTIEMLVLGPINTAL